MKHALTLAAALLAGGAAAGPPQPTALTSGLKNPAAVAVGGNGKVYVTAGGGVTAIDKSAAAPYVTGLDEPTGVAAFQKWLYVSDARRVVRIDTTGPGGAYTLLAPANAFPREPHFLSDVCVDPESGTVYVTDAGAGSPGAGAVYRITQQGVVSLVTDEARVPGLASPSGLVMDGASHLLVAAAGSGVVFRVKLADGTGEKVADGLPGVVGLAWDPFGRLFLSDFKGRLHAIPKPGLPPVPVADGLFRKGGHIAFDRSSNRLLVPDPAAGTVNALPAVIPGYEVDDTPLSLKPALAFPKLKWTGWSGETDTGKPNPLRPIVLTHFGDGSNRVVVATQHGVIHAFPNDQAAAATKVFLDIQDRVKYDDRQNEEGFLGLCFHPRYKETGEFFVFYTPKKEKGVNVVSRFRVSKDDPDRADPASEEEVIRFRKPYWNHDGGTICFGPDGFLYITHGDGGLGNDPHDNGQSLGTLLGKVHRIDVDHKADGKNYAIPKDNPFVAVPGARPEIFAYGLRNVWRMAFDRKTGQLWAADVGQNLYEEIDLIVKGGNYGWNRREALHPFGARGRGAGKEFVDPVWEYHHDVGKSLTGGTVYRGKLLPELDGHYVYGDYVTAKVWALKYDESKGRVVANRPVKDPAKPILSFGEDEQGEVYLLTTDVGGRGIYWFVK